MVGAKEKGKEIAGESYSSKRKPSRPPDGKASTSRKSRRSSALRFLDHVADMDDDDDYEEDDDSDPDYLSDDGVDLEDYGKQQKHNQIPFLLKEEEANDSENEKFIRERYKKGSKYGSHAQEAKGSDEENPSMQFHGDPVMWKVKCTCGHERKLVVCLLQKFIDLHSVGKKMELKSAFSLEHVKGYIYLEADRDSDIVEACKGLFGIYTNTIVHIPSSEIPSLFSVRGASMAVSRGQWVRVKHGTYKGDLAKVIDVDDRRHRSATIKLVPRVDLQAVVNKTDGKKTTKRGTSVPTPRLIRAYELEKLQQFVKLKCNRSTGEVFEIIGGLTLKDGFLYKKVRLESLNFWDVRPSDIELEQFKDLKRVSKKDHQWLSKLYGERRNNKSKEVNKVDNGKGSSLVSCDMSELELFDLVFFEKKRFGVIIGIQSDSFQILKGNCERLETTTVAARDIKKQQREEETTSLDHNSNSVSLNDVVRIFKGPFKGKQGIVKHNIQGILFIYDNNQIEANGFCCAETKNCEAIKYSHPPSDESFFGPVPPGFETSTSLSAEPELEQPTKNPFQHRERPASAGLRSRSSNGDFYVGQTLRIRVGPLKGYLCRVIDAYRSDITVKLDSQMKVIKVKVDDVTMVVAKGYDSVARDKWTGIPSASADLWNEREVMSTDHVDGWGKPASERNNTDGAMSSGSWGKDIDGWENERDGRRKRIDDKTENWKGLPNQWEREAAAACGRPENWPGGAGGWNNESDARNPTDDKMQSWDKNEVAVHGGPSSWGKAAGGGASKGDQNDVMTHTLMEEQTGFDDKVERCGKPPTGGWEDKMGNKSGSHCEGWNGQQEKARVAAEKGQVDFRGSNEGKGASWSQGASWDEPSNAWNKQIDAPGCQADCWGGQEKDASSGQVDGWDKAGKAEGNEGDGWSKASNSLQEDKGGGWDRTIGEWNKGKNAIGEQVGCSEKASGGWGKQTDISGTQTNSWHSSGRSQSRQDGSGWQKSGCWPESGLVGGSEYGGWNRSNPRNESRSDYERMDRAPERGRGRGRWNGRGGRGGKPRTECSDNANSFHGHQLGGWQKNEINDSGHWKENFSDTNGRQAGGGGGSWERAETGGSNKLDGWGNASGSKSAGADKGGKYAGSWRMSSGSQTWDKPESADRRTLHEEAGGWGMPSASQSQKNTGPGDGNASDGWGKAADNKDTFAHASREAIIWGMPSGSQNIPSSTKSWNDADSAGRSALNCREKAAEGRKMAADTGKVDGLGGVSSVPQSLEKKQNSGGLDLDASRIDTATGNRVVNTNGKDGGAWVKYTTSLSWDKKENTGGDASDGWAKCSEDRNGAVGKKMNEAGCWEKSSGFQHENRTENANGNASGGWEDLVDVQKDSTNESSEGHGGWDKLSGFQIWGSSSGGWGKSAEGWKSSAGPNANEVGDWGKANALSVSHSLENTGDASTNKDGWGKAEDGWKSTSNPSASCGDWKNSVPTSWEKVNDWQQSAETGEDSKAMHEDGSKGWNRPRFGGNGRPAYPGRGSGPRADIRGLLGRGPSDVNGRGGRGNGSFNRFGRGVPEGVWSDGNGRRGSRAGGPNGGSTRNLNIDDDGGQPENWSKPVEPESHKSGSWSLWSTASGGSEQTNGQRRQRESLNEGGNRQWNMPDPAGGNESVSWSSWASAAAGSDQAKEGNEGSGW
ncbi:unnamed protein product [Victoria cruziana]